MWIFSIRRINDLMYVNPAIGKGYVCIRKSFEHACERAKLKGLILHNLKRTFATRLLEAGVDIVSISELLDHLYNHKIYCISSRRTKQDAVPHIEALKRPFQQGN